MKTKQFVCTLQQAKRLKELGVKQKSIFYWEGNLDSTAYFIRYIDYENKKIWEDTFSAFTVTELGIMMPPHILSIKTDFNKYLCYSTSNTVVTDKMCEGSTEAEVRAAMLIHLLESNLFGVKDITK